MELLDSYHVASYYVSASSAVVSVIGINGADETAVVL